MQDLLTAPLIATIAETAKATAEQVSKLLGPPTKAGMADLALPCFALAKGAGCNPAELAGNIASALETTHPGIQAQAAGPFLNITLTPAAVAQAIITPCLENPQRPLRSQLGDGKTICVDFSSPNIAKHLAFHHIRSTMIGNALAHLYDAAGWNTVRINFLGDWGTAFGRLIAGWKRENYSLNDLNSAEDKVTFLNELYVRISQAAKADETVMDEARAWSKKLEDGDSEARELWQIFKDASLTEFNRVYDLVGVHFDSWKGEAYYEDKMQPLLDELEHSGLLSVSDDATVVDLSDVGLKKPCLIKRADGGTLYATRDLTACDDRFAEFNFDRSVYVVDLGQSLHFKEWYAVAKKLGRSYADNLRHVGFGIVLMWDEENEKWARVATRNGVPMLLTDVLNESIERARAIIEEKNPDLPEAEKESVAKAVGMGAVVFNDLKNGRTNDVKFKFEDALNMQGETGPYLQFAHARLCSIERKFTDLHSDAPAANTALLTRTEEKDVLLHISRLQAALERAVDEDEPSVLASGLLSLASTVSSWLTAGNTDRSARVLCEDAAVSSSRLQLVRITRATLGEGLRLLGLGAPERM